MSPPWEDRRGKPGGSPRPLIPVLAVEGGAGGVVLVAHVLLQVGQRHLAGRAVALLGDDDLDDALVLARLLGLAVDAVNVKAKTGERVSPIGRAEAIACQAVALIEAAGTRGEPNQ